MIVFTSPLGRQVIDHLRRNGEAESIFHLSVELRTSYWWLREVLCDLERQGVVEIDRSGRAHRVRLVEK